MVQFIVIAARNCLQHRSRTLFIGGAIAAITALLVLFTGITAGIQYTIITNGVSLATGHVNIAGFYKLSQTSATPVVTRFARLQEIAKKEIPEARLIVDRVKSYGKIISDSQSLQLPMWGVDYESERAILDRLPVAEGKLQEIAKPGNMALFASHAKRLNVKVGDVVTLSMPTNRNVNNTKDVRIATVLQDLGLMSSFTIFLNKQDVREIYELAPESTGQIMIFLRSIKDVPAVEERLRKLLPTLGYRMMEKDPQPYWMKFEKVSAESWIGQKIDITTWQDETSFVKWIVDLFNMLTVVFTTVLLAIVVLGLMNNLWMAIRERTTEIGTLRAIGLQRRQVIQLFVLEALILSCTATLGGIGIGSALCGLLNLARIPITVDAFKMFLMSDVLVLSVEPATLIGIFVLLNAFLVTAALIPSYRAGKLKPVTAMNSVN